MWQPIGQEDFDDLVKQQEASLTAEERSAFNEFRVPRSTATIRRTEIAGDEKVFVIAVTPKGVLYFDDVEYGFNLSPIDDANRLTDPGGNQCDLAEAISKWLVPQAMKHET